MWRKVLSVVVVLLAWAVGASALASAYLANTDSGKFHYPDCRTIKHQKAGHFIELETRAEAISRGLCPARFVTREILAFCGGTA